MPVKQVGPQVDIVRPRATTFAREGRRRDVRVGRRFQFRRTRWGQFLDLGNRRRRADRFDDRASR
ncbi:hypothetical protein C4K01_2651 [Pseudomonas synxantha]|nr:hypothetical protein C4K01_2651 [Pseudomonas synxantha]